MKYLSLKKNVSSTVLVIAGFSASEDFVNCPDIFRFKKYFLKEKKGWIGKGRMKFVSRNYNLFEKETSERILFLPRSILCLLSQS